MASNNAVINPLESQSIGRIQELSQRELRDLTGGTPTVWILTRRIQSAVIGETEMYHASHEL
jgi:hypothetical protein